MNSPIDPLETPKAPSRLASLISVLGVVVVLAALTFSYFQLKAIESQVAVKQKQLSETVTQLTEKETQLTEKKAALSTINNQLEDLTKQASAIKLVLDRSPQVAVASGLRKDFASFDSKLGNIDVEARAATDGGANTPSNLPYSTSIAGLFAPVAAERGRSYDALIPKYRRDIEMVNALLAYAIAHKDNANGVYNSLVVFSNLDNSILTPEKIAELKDFASSVRSLGGKTSRRADILMRRLPK